MSDREHGVIFWKKDSGNFMTHSGGLTEEDIATLQSLKQGDRIMLFLNNKRTSETAYHLKLVKHKPNKPQNDSI